MLMDDPETILDEAHSENDNEMCNHLKKYLFSVSSVYGIAVNFI